jgi:hypothetical protein
LSGVDVIGFGLPGGSIGGRDLRAPLGELLLIGDGTGALARSSLLRGGGALSADAFRLVSLSALILPDTLIDSVGADSAEEQPRHEAPGAGLRPRCRYAYCHGAHDNGRCDLEHGSALRLVMAGDALNADGPPLGNKLFMPTRFDSRKRIEHAAPQNRSGSLSLR